MADKQKLTEYTDANGVSVQAYVETLLEKVDEQEGMTVVVLVAHSENQLNVLTNVKNEHVLPDILRQLAAQMKQPKKSFEIVNIKKAS